ncbi:MAG: hypothetical protein Q4F34_03575 [Prevotellaceae bacterium]|nr:hypothetical protein [Prevotellaceae bacterium]
MDKRNSYTCPVVRVIEIRQTYSMCTASKYDDIPVEGGTTTPKSSGAKEEDYFGW